jgi:hypothetical protein
MLSSVNHHVTCHTEIETVSIHSALATKLTSHLTVATAEAATIQARDARQATISVNVTMGSSWLAAFPVATNEIDSGSATVEIPIPLNGTRWATFSVTVTKSSAWLAAGA